MISLILPYWDRQEAANKALHSLAKHYSTLDLEVIVVDDGNRIAFFKPELPLNIKVITLPEKDGPTSCIRAWNVGAKAAQGEIIVLSCVEVIHEQPVLEQMREQLQGMGLNGYVLASAFCPETQEWHCHSTHKSAGAHPIPPGTGRSFCGMMSRSLFVAAGGFDEDYMAGVGYEDCDFINRLLKAGAQFAIRDDLTVIHPKTGASIAWPGEWFARNKALFDSKWPAQQKINFVCLNAGNYCGRGAEYVNVLYDAVCQHMPSRVPFDFYCLTDNAEGLNAEIKVMELPADLERWWGKLYMFKRGLFPDGSRMVFLDLDTLVIGKLDDILGYRGQMAILRDFFFPERGAPGVVLWEAGAFAASIWDEWVAQGKPRLEMGDLEWIENLDQGRFTRKLDRLQDIFPQQFVSYKAHCAPLPPKGARVVCFHGNPRPHEANDDWVQMAWQVGGKIPANFEVIANTEFERVAHNIKAACARDIPWLKMEKPHDGIAAVIGGGPSLKDFIPEIKEFGGERFAVNGAHGYLADNGVDAAQVVIDARADNARFINGVAARYLASQCAPELFDKADGPLTLVHMFTRGMPDLIPPTMKEINLVSSGSTAGLAAIAIAYVLGYRQIYVYGMDSSFDDKHHAYAQPENDADRVIDANCGGRTFKTTPWMVAQVQAFQKLAHELAQDDCEIHVRCYGLLGHVAWLMTRQQSQAA